MIPLLNAPYFARIYSVANTPSFLYRNLVRDDSVREMARTSTIDELVTLFNDSVHRENRSVGDVGTAYAVVVATTLRPYSEVLATLPRLDTAALDWAADVVNYWNDTRIETVSTFHAMGPTVDTPSPSSSANVALGFGPAVPGLNTDISSSAATKVVAINGVGRDD